MHLSGQVPILFLVVLLVFCRGILSCNSAILGLCDFSKERKEAGVPGLKWKVVIKYDIMKSIIKGLEGYNMILWYIIIMGLEEYNMILEIMIMGLEGYNISW